MSYQCVEAVLRSHLPSHRKITLLALAECATPDGSEMWASIDKLARRASKKERIITRDLAWLEERGIIAEVSGRQIHGAARVRVGGRNLCPRYRLNLEALGAYRALAEPRHPDQGFESKPCIRDQAIESKPCLPDQCLDACVSTETVIPTAETLILRAETMIQESPDPKDPKDPSSNTAASPPVPLRTLNATTRERQALLSRAPAAGGNVRAISKIAHAVFDEVGRSSPDDPDLIELVKVRCAEKRIAYGPPDVPADTVARAMTLAHMQRTMRRRAS